MPRRRLPFAGSSQPVVLNSLNSGYFVSDGRSNIQSSSNNLLNAVAAGKVQLVEYISPIPWLLGHVTISVATGLAASFINCGIYDKNGNLLIDSGAMSGAASSVSVVASFPQVVIPAGVFRFAFTTSSTVTLTLLTFSWQQASAGGHSVNGSFHDVVQATNSATNLGTASQALPKTTGPLAAISIGAEQVLWALWEA